MKKLHIQEIKTCSACPNLTGQVLPICTLLNDAIPVNCNVYEQIYYHCPLPDFNDSIEILANPNPSFWVAKGKGRLTRKQQVAIANLQHIAQRLKASENPSV